jgi:subtilase family serine protease
MKSKTRISCALAPLLVLSLVPKLLADSQQVGGPRRIGHGRPPLYINLTPAASVHYSPAQLRHAYGVDQLAATGTNQKIAIVDAYGNANIQNDLNTFCSQFGLNSTTIQILGNNSGTQSGWALETALDVEWAHAIAPGATIILSVAATSSFGDLLNAVDAAVNAGATVVSMSWGSGEFSGMSIYDNHFNRPNVTFTASSGDSGAEVEWPAASPYVIAVGGTTLYLDGSNNRSSESGWSGSGGGLSSYYSAPAFQTGWQTSGHRAGPDVSYVADPNTGMSVYDSSNGGWFVVGGTSAGAPQWAALVALVNELRRNAGASFLGWAQPAFYSVGQGSATTPYAINGAYFFDVTQGNNGNSATPGYDVVTGLGSPLANALIPAMAPSVQASPDFSLSASPSSQNIKTGSTAAYAISINPVGGFSDVVGLSLSGLPVGASATFSPPSLTGSGSSTLTVTTSRSVRRAAYALSITGTSNGSNGARTHSTTVSLKTH